MKKKAISNSLDLELQPYVQKQDAFLCIKHPLVYVVPYFGTDIEIEHANRHLELKKLKILELVSSRQFELFVFYHERPYRFNSMIDAIKKFELNDQEIGMIARKVWCDSENIHELRDSWHSFLLKRCRPLNFMSLEDIRTMNDLPSSFPIYQSSNSMSGMSWSLSRETALWFANRFSRAGDVIEQIIKKENIWAYTDSNGEKEVILLSEE